MKHLRLSILTLILAIALASLTSYNVSALNYSATDIRSYRVDRSCANLTNSELTNYCLRPTIVQGNLDFAIPTNTKSVNSFTLGFTNNTPSKYIMNVAYRYCPRNPDALIGWTGFSSNAGNAIVEQDWIINGSCVSGSVSVFGATQRNNVNLGASNYGSFTAWDVQAGAYADFNTPTFIILSDDADYSTVLNDIKNNTNDIKTKLDDLKSSMDGLADQEERVADVAEDEYNKTIQDEQTASSGAGGFSFNFSLPNPFSIFQVSDGCVSTPTIDSWLHLEGDWKSPHCPIIPANVRNTLTPVVSLIITLATLLVVIRWVSSSAVDVAGNSVAMNDKPQKGGK